VVARRWIPSRRRSASTCLSGGPLAPDRRGIGAENVYCAWRCHSGG
jgi:hypothetical protein